MNTVNDLEYKDEMDGKINALAIKNDNMNDSINEKKKEIKDKELKDDEQKEESTENIENKSEQSFNNQINNQMDLDNEIKEKDNNI